MLLRRLYVDNFRCLVNFEFKPEAVNLLLGRNGSGKSTMFDAIKAIERVLLGHSLQSTLGAETLPWWDTRRAQRFELELADGNEEFGYSLTVRHGPRETPTIVAEELKVDRVPQISLANGLLSLPGIPKPLPFDGKQSALATGLAATPATTRFLALVRRLFVFRLNPWGIDTDARDDSPVLDVDGRNFVGFLKSWSQSDPEAFVEWKRRALRSLPHLEDLQLRELVAGSRMLVGMKHVDGKELLLSLAMFSEGERLRLVLQAVAGMAGRPVVVGLDEPDNFLAPSEVQPLLRSFTIDPPREPAPQLMIVTHHPESIDYLASYATWLFERSSEGLTRVRRLEFDRVEGERPTDALLSVLS